MIRQHICILIMLFAVVTIAITPDSHAFVEGMTPSLHTVVAQEILTVLPSEVSLGDIIEVTIEGLEQKVAQDKVDPKNFRLVLNEHPLQNLKPETVDLRTGTVRFHLTRLDPDKLDADKDAWTSLLGASPVSGRRKVLVGVAWDASHEFARAPSCGCTIKFVLFEPYWAALGLISLIVAAGALIRLARSTDILRDPQVALLPAGASRPYSLARCQMAFWFFLVMSGVFAIWLVTGEYNHTVTQQTLVLLGISAATGLSATAIDRNKENVPSAVPPVHTTFFNDLLTDSNGLTFYRYQMLLWTLILGIFYIVSVYRTATTPDFDANLLTLMGISSGTYLGFKLPEKQG